MRKIAIIGATGMLGQPVAKAFIHAGHEVTLFVRNLKKAKAIFGSDAKLIGGDLAEVENIRQFLDGQQALYLNLAVAPSRGKDHFQPEREGVDNILEAVKNSQLERIGYLSSLVHFYQGTNGFDWWGFAIKKRAVEQIKTCGLPYSIFYPSTFMESFDRGAYRQGSRIALAGTSKHKMFLIAGRDYAKQVVKAFQLNNGDQEFIIQGQEGYTADEAAKFYVDNYKGKKIAIMKAPLGLLSFLGKFSNKMSYGAYMIEALNNYPEKFEAEKTWNVLGKPETQFIDYVRGAI
jgi:nucleoside-diphosphate-sugar epimerase